MKSPWILALACTSLLSLACDRDDDDEIVVEPAPPASTTEAQPDPALTSTDVNWDLPGKSFETPCLAHKLFNLTSLRQKITFGQNGEWSKEDNYFLGDTCGTSPYLSLRSSGSYQAAPNALPDRKPGTIDLAVAKQVLVVQNEQLLITFNANGYCGKGDWTLNGEVALDSVNCDFVSTLSGTTVPEIYIVESHLLYFGGNLEAKAGAPRPTEVDRNVGYRDLSAL